jgi:predicted transcriptional regulator
MVSKDDSKDSVNKLFLHDKPFLLLKVINDSRSPVYAASISKKIDCSYAYIVRLIKIMNKMDITYFEGNNHKKIINLTPKGKKIFKLLSEIN